MSKVIIFDKNTQTQNLVEGPEVTLQTASVVIVNAGQLSVRQMTRSGDNLIIDFLDKKRLVIKKFFDDRDSKENSLVFNDNGQLTEAVIQEPALANQPLGVSYEPFQQSAQNAQGADSVLGKISSSFNDLSPLTKGALLGGAALGVFALTQSGGGGGGGHRVNTVKPNTTAPEPPQVKTATKADGTMAVTGKGAPGSRIDFTFPDGSKISVIAGNDGSFSFASKVPQPNGSFTATATDSSGRTSKTLTGNYTADPSADTSPPPPPTGLTVITKPTGGIGITGKAEPNSTVNVTTPDGKIHNVKAGPDGNFKLDINGPQPNGKIIITATDAANNKSLPAILDFTADPKIDTTPPDAPTGLNVITKPTGGISITGKAEPNSTVNVTTPDGKTHNVKAGPDGNFKLDTNGPQPNGKIIITATDAANNKSLPATLDFIADPKIDTTPPDAPTGLNVITKPTGGIGITGKAEPNSTVNVTTPDGKTHNVKAGPDGNFKLDINDPQPNGKIIITATDAANNKSLPAILDFVAVPKNDTTPPDAPTGLNVITKPTGGIGITGKAEPNSTVNVTTPDGKTHNVKAGPDGNFKLDINDPQPNGKIIITATDAANNKSLPAILDFIADPKIDTTPPDAPTGLNVITKPTGGIGISGKAEPNSTVNVTTPDGKTHNVKAGPDGNFKLDINDPQPNGKIIITATDAANNKSLPAILEFIADPKIDTTPPDAPTGLNVISKPNEGIAITGKAEPNSTVNITSPDGKTHNVKAGPDGNFKLDINDPQPNGNISAVAIDAAGNKSVPANLTYNLARPSAPTYDIATDQATGEFTLTGKSAPGLKVRIELPNKVTKTVVVDADGNFTLSGPAPQGTSEFKAVAIDGQGRESAATVKSYENPFTKYEVKVESYTDTVGSDGQIIANNKFERHPLNVPTNDPAPTLHGRATGVGSGNSIEIISKGDGKRVALGAVDSDGNWSIKLPAHSDGVYNYDVRIIDGARNVKGAQVTVNLTIDTVPPPAPTLDSIVTKDGVDVKSGKATVDNTPTLRGHAEANATVIIFHKNADGKNVELMRVVADANGEWTAALPFQSNRQHSYYVNALDAASNLSEASSVSQVTFNGPTNKPIAITGSQGVWSVDSAGNVDGSGFDSVAGLGYDSGNYNALLRGNANVSESQHPKYQLGNIDTGFHTAGLGDTNGDGLNDIASVHSGTNSRSRADVRVYNGAQNLGVTSEKYMKMFENPKVIGTGYFVSGAGDLDGDGLMDTVLGGYGAFGQNGTSTVVFGGKQVDPKNTVTDFKFGASDTNVNSYDAFYSGAQYVSATGDFLGGGSRGIVTARGITIGNPDRGSISKTTDFEWVTGTGAREVNQVQSVAGVGDTNGDGFSDVLVNDGTNLFVVYGGTLAEFSKFRNKIVLEEKWLKENNRGYMIDASSALAAQPTKYGDVRALGDINGDGLMDFAYSTYGNSGAGAAKQGGSYGSYQNSYIIFGKADNEKIDMAKFTPKQGIVVPKEQADGASIAGRLDINGDGLPDIYVGSYQSSGKLYLGGTSLGAEPSISVDNTTGLAMGNADSNFIKGTAGNDTIYGKGGADVIYAGSGDDVIILNKDNLSFLLKGFQESAGLHGRLARIDGGNGIDTLAFEKDVNDFDLTKITTTGLGTIKTGVGLSRLANMEVLDLNGGNKMKLTIDLKHVMDMTSGMNMFNKSNFSSGLDEAVSRNQVVIKGSSDNVVEVKDKGEWKTESTKTIYSEGHAYNVYNSVGDHQGQLLIEQTINVNWV